MPVNGRVTELLHLYTVHELTRNHVLGHKKISALYTERAVELPPNGHGKRMGRYDFFVENADGTRLGIEVLGRPAHGKLKEKLAYANGVDSFVFVLPANALALYQKPRKQFPTQARPRFLGKEFADKNLFAWLFDFSRGEFVEKKPFTEIFNVKENGKRVIPSASFCPPTPTR